MDKKQQLLFEIKSLNEDGTFEGLLSPYNNIDDGNDLVEPGAFTKTLATYGNTVPMLWQHDPTSPIGQLTLIDQPDGLHCKGQFLLDIPEAIKAYKLLRAGVIKGLSIGYEAVKSQVLSGVRHLTEIRLYEGSVVTFPMNPLAQVSSIKAGRKFSADTQEKIGKCAEHIKSACDILADILSEFADPDEGSPDSTDDTDTKSAAILSEMRTLLLK